MSKVKDKLENVTNWFLGVCGYTFAITLGSALALLGGGCVIYAGGFATTATLDTYRTVTQVLHEDPSTINRLVAAVELCRNELQDLNDVYIAEIDKQAKRKQK